MIASARYVRRLGKARPDQAGHRLTVTRDDCPNAHAALALALRTIKTSQISAPLPAMRCPPCARVHHVTQSKRGHSLTGRQLPLPLSLEAADVILRRGRAADLPHSNGVLGARGRALPFVLVQQARPTIVVPPLHWPMPMGARSACLGLF
jgi:hypothetical protein